MRKTCNLGILFCNALCRINHNNAHITAFNSHFCTDNTVFFDIIIDFALTAKSCGIGKVELSVLIFNKRINCVTGCACYIGHNTAFLVCDFVYKR